MMLTENGHLLLFGSIMIVVWLLVLYFWPSMLLSVYKRALLVKGFGEGPIPLNTLYTQPQKTFAEPLTLQSGANPVAAGMNHDTLLTLGWLDLRQEAQVLHVPEMKARYYSVQFTDPMKNTNFAYVGTRATGTQAGDYLIARSGWQGSLPQGMAQISSPANSVLLIARVLVENEDDLARAYELSKQIQLTPLSQWKPA